MRWARLNPGQVPAGAALQLSKALHDGKTIQLDALAGSVVTLPPALGTGAKFRILERVAATSGAGHTIKVQNSTDVMVGGVMVGGTTTVLFPTAAASDTITLNRTTSGGATNGAFFDIEDVRAGVWSVVGQANGSGAVVTPFSATV